MGHEGVRDYMRDFLEQWERATFTAKMIVRYECVMDKDEALEAVGLSEQGAQADS